MISSCSTAVRTELSSRKAINRSDIYNTIPSPTIRWRPLLPLPLLLLPLVERTSGIAIAPPPLLSSDRHGVTAAAIEKFPFNDAVLSDDCASGSLFDWNMLIQFDSTRNAIPTAGGIATNQIAEVSCVRCDAILEAAAIPLRLGSISSD